MLNSAGESDRDLPRGGDRGVTSLVLQIGAVIVIGEDPSR
jgi:hypothetical protein